MYRKTEKYIEIPTGFLEVLKIYTYWYDTVHILYMCFTLGRHCSENKKVAQFQQRRFLVVFVLSPASSDH